MTEVDAPPNTTAEQDRQTAGERAIKAVAPPTATTEDMLHSKGQRLGSLVFAVTQAICVVSTLWVILVVLAWVALTQPENTVMAIAQLIAIAGFVVVPWMTYTNHTRVGGVGGDTAGKR